MRAAVGIAAAGLAFALVPSTAGAVVLAPTAAPLPGSNFQGGDGDQLDSAPNIDWQSLAGNPNLVSVNDPNTNDTIINGKENDPLDWDLTTTSGGASPPKTNFFDAWNYFDNGYLYLAFDREASGGNAFLAFELNQDTRLWKNANGDFIPCRTDGDLIISYQIQNSNNIDIVIQTWVSDSTVSAAEAASTYTNGEGCAKTGHFIETDPGAANAEAAINYSGNPVAVTNPDGSVDNFLPGTSLTKFGEALFGEAALNLPGIYTGAGANPCFSFGQISMHGRTAKSVSASLSDVVSPVAAVVRNCTISGTKWSDDNGNGVRDPGEAGIKGYVLFLDENNDGNLDPGEPTATTDANGDYVFTNVAAGDYTVREAPDADQPNSLQGMVCTDPNPCEHAVTISQANMNSSGNDFGNFKPGSVTVKKLTNPAGGTGFQFHPDAGLGGPNFTLDDGQTKTFSNVVPGTYTVDELAKAGWDLSGISCDDNDSSGSGQTAEFNVDPGENVKCTFTNTQRGTVTVAKTSDPAGGTGFGFQPDAGLGGAPFTLDDGGSTAYSVAPGSYDVSEVATPNWQLTNIGCSDANSTGDVANATAHYHVGAGENVVCTFTNTANASLTIVKDAVPDAAQAFGFTTTGSGMSDFSLDDDGDNSNGVSNTKTFTFDSTAFGAKTVSEASTSGWTLSSVNCTGDPDAQVSGATASLNLGAGENAVCTFTNTQNTEPKVLRHIHYSLRFRYGDKHGHKFVIARVYCHSVDCVLQGTGTLTVLPSTKHGKAKHFKLGLGSGSFEYTHARSEAGFITFSVPPKGVRAVGKAIRHHDWGSIRANINMQGLNTLQPDLNKRRYRGIKLFAGKHH
jgi:hypothetical protein